MLSTVLPTLSSPPHEEATRKELSSWKPAESTLSAVTGKMTSSRLRLSLHYSKRARVRTGNPIYQIILGDMFKSNRGPGNRTLALGPFGPYWEAQVSYGFHQLG